MCGDVDSYCYVVDEMIRHLTIEIDIPEGSATLCVQYWYAPATWGRDGGDPKECEIISARDIEDGEDRWEELPVDIQDFIIQRCMVAGPKGERNCCNG